MYGTIGEDNKIAVDFVYEVCRALALLQVLCDTAY
jgi:hypothetical protein